MSSKENSLWTPANIVTIIRVFLVPVWLLCAELGGASSGTALHIPSLLVALFFIALSLTDKLDGYLARSRGEVTTFGKFLDPIADKLVVVVALCFLLEVGQSSAWILLVIVAREFLVSGLRMVVAAQGTVIAASWLGKWKTATTMVAISGLLIYRCLPDIAVAQYVLTLSNIILFCAVVLTLWSGIDYFLKSKEALLRVSD